MLPNEVMRVYLLSASAGFILDECANETLSIQQNTSTGYSF